MTAQELVDFETEIKNLWETGQLPSLVHLCGGNEGQLIHIFREIKPGDWVFSTHRTHYHALLAGVDTDLLRETIKRGDSMFVYSKQRNFLCSAVLAGCCGIAAGVAWAIKNDDRIYYRNESPSRGCVGFYDQTGFVGNRKPQVWCFIGDGGEEEGHFYEAAMFVEANNLPCTFVIEDNNRSVDTSRESRRNGAKGLEHLFKCVRRYHYKPIYPHAGSGCNFKIEFKPDAVERHKRR